MAGASDTDRPEAAHAADLLAYLAAAPSPYHAVAEGRARLVANGFAEVDPGEPWPASAGRYLTTRGGSLVAWISPPVGGTSLPFRIVGAHTDSPNLRIKPRPDTTSAGLGQLAVEVYGGALYNSWLDRDLGLSGRVVVSGLEGTQVHLFRTDEPLARIPQLAIHLDRGVNDGLTLNPQQHLVPVWSLAGAGREDGGLRGFLAEQLAAGSWVDPDDIVSWDLMFHDANPPARVGRFSEFISSGRIDNLLSCHAGLCGLTGAAPRIEAGEVEAVPVLALFDHEEVGSQSASGAAGAWLAQCLERIALARGASRADFLASLATSSCVSVDGAHATHPNYTERHEPGHPIRLDGGPVVKVNANQRYATDATAAAMVAAACARAGVPLQHFVSRNDMPCGSTIGPFTAAGLAVATADAGCAMLAMHSARELCGVEDPWRLAAMITEVFAAS